MRGARAVKIAGLDVVQLNNGMVAPFAGWMFVRTMARDYGRDGYPWRRITPRWNAHLRGPVFSEGCPALWRTKRAALSAGRRAGYRGRAVPVGVAAGYTLPWGVL